MKLYTLLASAAFVYSSQSAQQWVTSLSDGTLTPLPSTSTPSDRVITSIASYDSDIYVAGRFTVLDGTSRNRIAKWNGSSWSDVGSSPNVGYNNTVKAMAVFGGDLYVGGFDYRNNPWYYLKRWNGTAWSDITAVNNTVYAMSASGSYLYLGGSFSDLGHANGDWVAKFNGTSWSNIGTGTGDFPTEIAASWNGDVFACGGNLGQHLYRYNGSSWSGINSTIPTCLISLGYDLYVGGVNFSASVAGGGTAYRLAKYYSYSSTWENLPGVPWQSLNGASTEVHALAFAGTVLYVGGKFNISGNSDPEYYLYKYNIPTATWTPISGLNGPVHTIGTAGADVYVAGNFTTAGGNTANGLAKLEWQRPTLVDAYAFTNDGDAPECIGPEDVLVNASHTDLLNLNSRYVLERRLAGSSNPWVYVTEYWFNGQDTYSIYAVERPPYMCQEVFEYRGWEYPE